MPPSNNMPTTLSPNELEHENKLEYLRKKDLEKYDQVIACIVYCLEKRKQRDPDYEDFPNCVARLLQSKKVFPQGYWEHVPASELNRKLEGAALPGAASSQTAPAKSRTTQSSPARGAVHAKPGSKSEKPRTKKNTPKSTFPAATNSSTGLSTTAATSASGTNPAHETKNAKESSMDPENLSADSLTEARRMLLHSAPLSLSPQATKTFPSTGWGTRNVLSARNAWARVRLPELLATSKTTNKVGAQAKSSQAEQIPSVANWHNEETAEKDLCLAALLEGLQIYLERVVKKALPLARQRLNRGGLRLSYQATDMHGEPPVLKLRLGCNVERQVAQAHGNAAMTCKRQEEALERQPCVPRRLDQSFDYEMLQQATSMEDLAQRPKLARGADDAEIQGKRYCDGADDEEPPLGQVPKRAKLEVSDIGLAFELGQRGTHYPGALRNALLD